LAWEIEFLPGALKEFQRLAKRDPAAARRIDTFLTKRLRILDNPRGIGQALKGKELGELWKYRVGDYRIIADIRDAEIVILIVRIGNRKDVYR
jgi:mRNA interferase RelE/StbE